MLGDIYLLLLLSIMINVLMYSAILLSIQNDDSPQLRVTCIQQLSNFIGVSIFRGRVEQYNPKWATNNDD